jgi:NAD+ kinase
LIRNSLQDSEKIPTVGSKVEGRMAKVAIISKPQKQELSTVLPELLLWLKAHAIEFVLDPVSGSYSPDARIVPRELLTGENPDLVIVLGGDGTLLAAARVFAATNVPIMSVNLGSLGFLTEVPLSQMYPTLEGWLETCCEVESRPMIRADLRRGSASVGTYDALNDVVVSKGAIARMADFSIRLDGSLVANYRADGVIISTPTGSTAYSLAANGPILLPRMDAMVITPVCPHLLTIRPLVVPGDAQVELEILGVPDQTYLTIDGQEAVVVRVGDVVICKRSPYAVKMLRLGSTGFFDVLRQKLKWGER